MVQVTVTGRGGSERVIEVEAGLSLVKSVGDNGRATEAVRLAKPIAKLGAALPDISNEENYLLDSSDNCEHRSRLPCHGNFRLEAG